MKLYKFEKDPDGRWYIVLPEWEWDRAALEMVLGADILLEYLAQGENTVQTMISTTPIDNSYKLTFLREEMEGGWYLAEKEGLMSLEVWLCAVTIFVFGELPKEIYFSNAVS